MRTTRIVAIAVVVSLVVGIMNSPVAAAKPEVSAEAMQHYKKARQLLDQDEIDKAMIELKTAIQLFPEFIEAQRAYLGNLTGQMNVEKIYEANVKDNPKNAVYHYLLGQAYEVMHFREAKARAENKKALELAPDFAWANLAEASFARGGGDRVKAFEYARKAQKLAGDNVELHAELAKLFYGFRDYAAVAEEVKIVQKIDPANFGIYNTKWKAIMAANDGSDKAKAEIAADVKRLETDPSKNAVALSAAKAGRELTDPKSKLPQRMKYGEPSLTGPANEKFQQAMKLKKPAESLKALSELESQVEAGEKAEVLLPAIVKAQIAVGDIQGAVGVVRQLSQAGATPVTDANASLEVARALVDGKQFGPALDLLNSAVEKLKKFIDTKPKGDDAYQAITSAFELQGQALVEQGRPEKAVAALTECQNVYKLKQIIPPASLSAKFARAYAKLGKEDEAIAAFTRAYCIDSHRVRVLKNHAALVKENSQEALEDVPEKEKAIASIKTDLQVVYGKCAEQKPLETFLKEQLELYNKKLTLEAMMESKTDKPAADFELALVNGGVIRLSALRGKVVVLNFLVTNAEPCREEYPHFQSLQTAYKDKDVVVALVCMDMDSYLVKPFVDKMGSTAKVALSDGFIQHAYGVTWVPHTVVIDKRGVIRFKNVGLSYSSDDFYCAMIDSLLAEKEKAVPAATVGK